MKVNEIITNNLIEKIEKEGILPWHKPWNTFGFGNFHSNFYSKKPYRGLNRMITSMSDFTCPFWATFKQISDHKGSVKAGEHSTIVVFWKRVTAKSNDTIPDDDNPKSYFLLRYYRIFNLEQTEGIDYNVNTEPTSLTPIEEIDSDITDYSTRSGVKIAIKTSDSAYYSPTLDNIVCPKLDQYTNINEYYSTIFHEIIHSTGHKSRLKRFDGSDSSIFGSESYSKEELVAELGSAFLRNRYGILTEVDSKNSAAYLKSWVSRLKNDHNLIIKAGGAAQKAYDYVVGETEMEEEN